MAVFFISDARFGDHRVLNLYPRLFANPAEMEAQLIRRWNEIEGVKLVLGHVDGRDDRPVTLQGPAGQALARLRLGPRRRGDDLGLGDAADRMVAGRGHAQH